jgi:hypothetical protein
MHFNKRQATCGLKYLMLASLPLLMGSCTLDEPKATVDENGSVSYGRLSSITYLTAPILSFTYDSQNRLTCIKSNNSLTDSDEDVIEISYDPLTIKITDYTDYESYYGGSQTVIDEVDTYTDITLNEQGYITSMTGHYTSYNYNQDYDGNVTTTESHDVELITLTYDSDSHLTDIVSHGSEGDSTYLTWKNGCLMSINDGESSFNFEYDTMDNTYGQWCPWDGTSRLFMTNLLGKAPVKLVSKTYEQDPDSSDSYEAIYAYKLNSLGQISVMRYSYWGETASYSFNYK